MKQENREFLDKHRHHYDTVIKAGYVKHLNANEREGMQRVMGEEFQPGYHTDLWCAPCLFDMVKLLYSRYDKWLEENQEVVEETKEPIKEDETKEPLKVAASFPKNDKPNDINPSISDNRPKRRNRR